jgi:hypothetical protein
LRILVDESLPRQFAAEIPGHDVSTVRAQRWLGLRNGVLLRAAVDAGFRVLVTADRSVEFQQNLRSIGIAVIILAVRNRMSDLRPTIPELLRALQTLEPGSVVTIGR